MQSETGFPSSHQLKSYVASKSRLKLAARAVLSADAGLLVSPRLISAYALPWEIGNREIASIHLNVACCFTKNKHILKYHLVTAEPPFTVKSTDCMHQTGPRKAVYHPAVCYPHAWCLISLSLCRSPCQKGNCSSSIMDWKSTNSIAWISYYFNVC